jgi:hypothetical protein
MRVLTILKIEPMSFGLKLVMPGSDTQVDSRLFLFLENGGIHGNT